MLGTPGVTDVLLLEGINDIGRGNAAPSGAPDAVADFDVALRDPSRPSRLNPRHDSGDHLHPNARGYEAMADAVDLQQLQGPACGRGLAIAVGAAAATWSEESRSPTVVTDG